MSNLNSITKLTEFPRLEQKEKADGLLSKFIWWRKPDIPGKPEQGTSANSILAIETSEINNENVSLAGQKGSPKDENTNPSMPSPGGGSISGSQRIRKTSSSSPLPSYYRSDSTLSNRSTNQSPEIMDGSISPFAFEARTLPNVLRRISSLIAMGTNNQTDIKKYWMPDSVSKECYECAEKFTTFRRKHHCRICGQIFCSRCCNQEIPGKIIGYSGDLRVCTYCSKIVLSYLQSALSSDMSDDLRVVQEDLQNRFGPSDSLHNQGGGIGTSSYGFLSTDHPSSYRSLPRRKISVGYQEERFATSRSIHDTVFDSVGVSNSSLDDKQKSIGEFVNLKTLWEEMTNPVTGIDWATHRHNMMKNYNSCVVGSELVDWLLAQRKISYRGQGVQIGQMLIDANLIECVSQAEQIFLDAYALYRPIQLPLLPPLHESSEPGSARSSHDFGDGHGNQDPLWVKQINQSNNSSNQHSNDNSDDREDSALLRRNNSSGRRKRDSNSSTSSHQQQQNFNSSNNDQTEQRNKTQVGGDPVKSRIHSTASMYSLDLNLSENTVYISKPKDNGTPYDSKSSSNSWDPYNNNQQSPTTSTKTTLKNPTKTMSITTETMTDEFLQKTLQLQKEQGKEFVPPTGWHNPHQFSSDSELLAFQRLCNAFIHHENEFLNQLLERMSLSESWADIILPIVHKVTEVVRPDVRHADDEMDIRQYVKFKKVSGGKKEDCRIVNGVVCTKNIAHRNMRQKLKDPKILIIGSSIDYQRFENRFVSLEPLVMQEYEYLRNAVARIASFQPDLVLVEKTVSRLAQDLMLDQGITLVINVKPSVMERVARCTQSVIATSADSQIGIGRPHLGMCHNFYVENFKVAEGVQKNLMFFDGCAMHLGCTVLLRGGANSELMKVKRIISLLTFVAYNWRLERSFHIDVFAMPPDMDYDKNKSTLTDVLMESPGNGEESEDFVSAHESSVDSGKSPSTPLSSSESSSVIQSPVKASTTTTTTITSNATNNHNNDNNFSTAVAVDNKKINTKSEICDPGSDPLQSFLASGGIEDSQVSLPREDSSEKLVVQFVPDSSRYSLRACLDEVKLSSSPFIKYPLPYLETEAGKNCALRKFFPEEIYWSPLIHRSSTSGNNPSVYDNNYPGNNNTNNNKVNGTLINPKIQWKAPHPFTALKITVPITCDEIQACVADFRRKGGRLDFGSHSSHGTGHSSGSVSHLNSWNVLENHENITTEKPGNGRIDALDPFRHQKLSVLFCSYSSISCNAPYYCVNPWVVNMDLYGRHDISLGMFLERYCFRKTYHCPARQCDTPMLFHLRRFVHEDGCVQVASKELESPILGNGENILMWNWCGLCKTVSPIVPMSVDAWSLSFAKYLEIRFHGHMYKRRGFDNQCDHSLHHDYVHYFAQHNIISWFKYSKIKLWEICMPATTLKIKTEPKTVHQLIDDVKVVAITGHGVFSSILEALTSLKETCAGLRVEEVVTSLLDHLKAERQVFRTKIEEIQINLTVPTLENDKANKKESDGFLWKVTDSIGYLRSIIADTIQSWNTRLHDLLTLRKKEEKQAKNTLKVENESSTTDSGQKPAARIESEPVLQNYTQIVTSSQSGTKSDLDESLKSGEQSGLESSNEFRSASKTSLTSGSTLDMSISGVLDELTNNSIATADESSNPVTTTRVLGSSDDLFVGNWVANNNTSTERRNITLSPPSPSQSVHRDAVQNHEISKSDGVEKMLDVVTSEDSPDFKTDKKSGSSAVKTIISHFLSGSGLGQVIQSPWLSTDHYFLATMGSIPVSVHESEPSSVVAFALSSNEYKTKLSDIIKNTHAKIMKSCEEDEGTSGKKPKYGDNLVDDLHLNSSSSNYIGNKVLDRESNTEKPLIELDQDEKERPVKGNGNIEVQFGSNTAKFYCRVYFAEQFCQLRALCMDVPEEFYIRSIARCVPWNATGGKSGSTFCKTVDDRFVVKQMSKFEIQSFLDFAPNYFEYIRKCYQEKKPTVLAKILGVYRIGFKNSLTSAQSKMDVLIMENLFYERNISQKFDLKGSIRNRLANVSGKEREDLVLLDENLVNMACENPWYIRPHTKAVLTVALGNDSQFLASQAVMDYSLLVGLDEQKNELVVGIIDYIRTFTWDKKIETFVKSSGILGGQGKMPTVVSPDEYYTRFLEAMDRYFNLVPNIWMGFGKLI